MAVLDCALLSAVSAELVEAGAFSPPFGLSLSKSGGCLGTVRAEPVEAWACWFGRRAGVEGGGRVVAPAGDSLSFASPKESKQRKGAPQSATPALRSGANLRRGGCGVRRGTRFALRAPLGQPRRVRARSTRAPTRVPPRNRPAAGAASRGWTAEQPTANSRTAPRAFASLGPLSRAQAPRAAQAGPSEAIARVDIRSPGFPSGCAWGAQGAGWHVCRRTHMLRELTHRSCSSGAPQARSEFCGAPRDRAPQVAP